MLFLILSYHIILYHIIYHILWCYTTLYHIILYYEGRQPNLIPTPSSCREAVLCFPVLFSVSRNLEKTVEWKESNPVSSRFIKGGVQWKQGVVICMMLYTSLLYHTTPIHCTPLRLHPPLMYIHERRAARFLNPCVFLRWVIIIIIITIIIIIIILLWLWLWLWLCVFHLGKSWNRGLG